MVYPSKFICLIFLINKHESYCIVCKKDTDNKNPKVFKTKNGRLMLQSTWSVCGNKKTRFINKNEGSGILSSLGLRIPLRKIPLLGDVFI